MKRAATHLLAKIALISKLSNFFFDLRPRGAEPRARQRSENPTTECANPRRSPGRWSGLELTDALSKDGVVCR